MDTIERIVSLARDRGVKQSFINNLIGGYRGKFTDWKNKKSSPSAEELQIIADYFEVSVGYLMGTEKEPAPKKEQAVDKETEHLLNEIQDLSIEEAAKVSEYIELLKLKRNQQS